MSHCPSKSALARAHVCLEQALIETIEHVSRDASNDGARMLLRAVREAVQFAKWELSRSCDGSLQAQKQTDG